MFHSRLALFAVVNSVFSSSSVSIPFSLDAEQIIGVCIKSSRSEWLNHHTSHSIFFFSYFFFCKRLKWYCIKRADFVFHFVFNGMRSLLFCKRLLSRRNQHGRERESIPGLVQSKNQLSFETYLIPSQANAEDWKIKFNRQANARFQIDAAMKMSFLLLCSIYLTIDAQPYQSPCRMRRALDSWPISIIPAIQHYLHFNLIFKSISFCTANKTENGRKREKNWRQ